jgi:ribonucleoside-diphosphate reductase beta chain
MLTEQRNYYKPFEYQWAYDLYRSQQSVHWTKDEIKLAEDLQNWNYSLNSNEKSIIGGILKGFVQMEVLIGDYWRKVAQWFPKPEIGMMASTFSYFESIHIDNYAMLNEELSLTDFKSFVQDPFTKDKLDAFMEPKGDSLVDKAKSLAIFSAFGEGVLVFSSFAALLSFQKENLMKGLGQIISFSIRDENIHSSGGIKLFNQLCLETSEDIKTLIRDDIYEAANLTYQLESKFIDNLFGETKNIRTLTAEQLKNFIKNRINEKLRELGYEDYYKVDLSLLKEMEWFYYLSSGREFGDFFATRVTEYTKYEIDASQMF